jgi:hypothetical protein
MRVEDRVRKWVVFLGHENEQGFTPYGTGFVCGCSYKEVMTTVIVTASHVVRDIPGDTISIRINRKEGVADVIKIKKEGFIEFHTADIVAIPYFIDLAIYDVSLFPLDHKRWLQLQEKIWKPGPGDEVGIVGLYTTHYGYVKNIPVVRIGHIAAMPEEKVMTHFGYVRGYLIEAHSIAGLSGSPVFVNVPRVHVVDGEIARGTEPAYIVIGILIGYHVIETKEDEIVVPQYQTPEERRTFGAPPKQSEERRTGFGVVIPIEGIFAFFESDDWINIMKNAADELSHKSGYRPASAVPKPETDPPASDENPTHLADFTRLVDVAARKKPKA